MTDADQPKRQNLSDETEDAGSALCSHHQHLLVLLFCVHTVLLSWCAVRNSFCWTEAGLLPSGIIDWQFGDFAAYRVNPPLIRIWAALPVLALDPQVPYYGSSEDPRHRVEWDLARAMIETNGTVAWTWLTCGRLMCVPFSLLGMAVAGVWAREQFGPVAQIGTVFLWTFSPWMIGYGCLMSGDAQAASMGVVVLYTFRRWLGEVSFSQSYILGVAAGVTVLTKLSWLILFGLLPMLWIVIRSVEWVIACRSSGRWPLVNWQAVVREVCLSLLSVVVCLLVINLAYGFKGSLKPLGEFRFISKALGGGDDWRMEYFDANQFQGTMLGSVPVPLPEDLVIGLDLQKWDFDRERWSYFGGEWRNHGWWFYYLFGLCVKTPLGSLVLFLLALIGTLAFRTWRRSWRDALVLLLPVCLILATASAETGLNRHSRYVLPVVPLLITSTGRIFQVFASRSVLRQRLVIACSAWQMLSSLWIYPHSHSYFNELIGGPLRATRFMNASNLDWGQDLKFFKEWCERHPDRRPVFGKYYLHVVSPESMGIPVTGSVPGMPVHAGQTQNSQRRFPVGWYIIDNESILRQQGDLLYLNREPDDHIGYGFRVFHVTEAVADQFEAQFYEHQNQSID